MDNDDYDTSASHHESRLRWLFRMLLGKKTKKISEEEVIQLLEEGTRSGVIDTAEHELIKSIFEFTDTTVKEIMVPRTDIVAVDLATPRDKLINTLIEEGFSRIPVYEGSTDNIVGIIYSKDLLSILEYRDLIILQDIIRPAFFVPETKKISALLRDLQAKRQHMAIVVDEFGGTEGLITMEDIIEEIVGDIRDEYDEEQGDVVTSSDGTVVINAGMNIHDFNNGFSEALPDDDDYETVGGFLHKFTGRIPELHEEIPYKNMVFTIAKKNERRIQQIKVKTVPHATDETDATNE
ncbi:MAG TPA: hemolysin family protein [Bacteroidota bacterium]|nr:hemolysin family protein [Bacteroidota bacterium]